jgi:hypothetical protein
VNEDDLLKLLAYVKSLGTQRVTTPESAQSLQTNAGAPVGQTASPAGISPSSAGPGGSATTTAGQPARGTKKP